jgi:hypothetical protein
MQGLNGPGTGTSYVLLQAFYADNSKTLSLWKELPSLAYWIFPADVGIPPSALATSFGEASPQFKAKSPKALRRADGRQKTLDCGFQVIAFHRE